MLRRRLPRTHQDRTSFARSIALAIIARCCSFVFLTGPQCVQNWSTGIAHAGETRNVAIQNYSFTPGSLTVPVGTTVTWTNREFDVHTVTADDTPPTFKSMG